VVRARTEIISTFERSRQSSLREARGAQQLSAAVDEICKGRKRFNQHRRKYVSRGDGTVLAARACDEFAKSTFK
jgi:hypothetical protein